MNAELIDFATRLKRVNSWTDSAFNSLALELFALQFKHNPPYRQISGARGITPNNVKNWVQAPFVPTAAFKEIELSSIAPTERTFVFHSSGTTEQKPSRHFHCTDSLNIYERALWKGFEENVIQHGKDYDFIVLTPPPQRMPHSSLIHMFETIRLRMGIPETCFFGQLDAYGAWAIHFDAALAALRTPGRPKLILGTAFSFVHLLDFLAERDLRLQLPEGSRVMETGGYKNRSRSMPKGELHSLITAFLGVGREEIVCEYGMSELSSQAYDSGNKERYFHFSPWARSLIVSPETGREVGEGETGLIRIFDLANVFSVAAVQTEDLAVRRGNGFELLGRAALAEPRGCSLMTA